MADNQAGGTDAAIEFLTKHEDVWKKWASNTKRSLSLFI
jgi:ABC-type proline/glycine betaine transport system substrate-binding protein